MHALHMDAHGHTRHTEWKAHVPEIYGVCPQSIYMHTDTHAWTQTLEQQL